MIAKTLQQYRSLSLPVRSLVFLFWIYSFTGALTGIFLQLFLYEQFSSVTLNMFFALTSFTGIMIGFVICGYLASILRINIKKGFFYSFLVKSSIIPMFLLNGDVIFLAAATVLLGIGDGLFWLTIHTFELAETNDYERDFYSSVLSAGSQICGLLGPALATLCIWLSGSILHLGNFTLLFLFAPLIYLAGFWFMGNLTDYYPPKIIWADIRHFFCDSKNQLTQLYLLGGGMKHVFDRTILPLAMLLILGTVLRTSVFDTLLAIFSVIILLFVAQYRHAENRLFIFGILTLLLISLTLWFGYTFTFVALVVYFVGDAILSPLFRVSEHVIDLQTMDSIGRKESDFFATMLLRDAFLWVWRIAAVTLFFFFTYSFSTEQEYVRGGLFLPAFSIALTYIGAFLLIRKSKISIG